MKGNQAPLHKVREDAMYENPRQHRIDLLKKEIKRQQATYDHYLQQFCHEPGSERLSVLYEVLMRRVEALKEIEREISLL
jgi:hypothetical protein